MSLQHIGCTALGSIVSFFGDQGPCSYPLCVTDNLLKNTVGILNYSLYPLTKVFHDQCVS